MINYFIIDITLLLICYLIINNCIITNYFIINQFSSLSILSSAFIIQIIQLTAYCMYFIDNKITYMYNVNKTAVVS